MLFGPILIASALALPVRGNIRQVTRSRIIVFQHHDGEFAGSCQMSNSSLDDGFERYITTTQSGHSKPLCNVPLTNPDRDLILDADKICSDNGNAATFHQFQKDAQDACDKQLGKWSDKVFT